MLYIEKYEIYLGRKYENTNIGLSCKNAYVSERVISVFDFLLKWVEPTCKNGNRIWFCVLYHQLEHGFSFKLLRDWTRNRALTDDIARKIKIYFLENLRKCLNDFRLKSGCLNNTIDVSTCYKGQTIKMFY